MSYMLLTLPRGNVFDTDNIEFLYEIFKKDFIDCTCSISFNSTYFNITVKPNQTCICPFDKSEKAKKFWHVITKKENDRVKKNNPCPDEQEKNRTFCINRARRIHWIKDLINNWQIDKDIVHYYQTKIDGTDLIIWHTKLDFLIVVKKTSNISDKLLVTSYIVFKDKKKRYEKEYKKYESEKPIGKEWF